jgi:hypothetical protein
MKNNYFKLVVTVIVGALFMLHSSCDKDPVIIDDDLIGGKVRLTFAHFINGQDITYDTIMYVNEAGNHYEVNEVRYFISDITFHKANGSKVVLKGSNEIKYVDKDYPNTLNWLVNQDIPVGSYTNITFTFGLDSIKNQSNIFVNAPEMNMFWPSYLGGGYHYLQLNMKWLDHPLEPSMNACHLGIGQIKDSGGNIIGFIHNNFTVTLPNSAFSIEKGKTTTIPIVMNLENWFKNPHTYDFNYWGGSIMENQDAMAQIAANGNDVFSTGSVK